MAGTPDDFVIGLGLDASKAYAEAAKLEGRLGQILDKLDDQHRVNIDTRNATQELAVLGQKAASFGSKFGGVIAFNQVTMAVQNVAGAMNEVVNIGAQYEASLAAVGSIVGKTGPELEKLGEGARALAREFGGSATSQLASYQGILSKFGPAVGDNPAALASLARNVSVLSAASGDDAATSMSALTDTMLQMGLVSEDSDTLVKNSTNVINALAAGARVGAAEVPQVAEALIQTGVAAKGANMDLIEVNAAIQVMALGGKYGAEAGTALRNVLGFLQKASGPAEMAMKKLGTSSKELGMLLNEQGLEAAMGKIGEGLKGLATDAERNAVMFKIFGRENAAAAGIILENLPKYAEFKEGIAEGMEGMGDAFIQAHQRMDTATTDMAIAKAKIESIFIDIFHGIGGGVSAALGSISQLAPMIMGLAGLGQIIPDGMFSKLATNVKDVLIPALVKLGVIKAANVVATTTETAAEVANTGAKIAQATATTGATGAQYALNTAMLANPVFLAVAGITALVGAYFAFRDTTKDLQTAMEDASTATAAFGEAQTQLKGADEASKKLNELAASYDKLQKVNTAAGQDELAKVADRLAAAVPEAAEAVDKLDEKGQRIGTTYRVSTQEVRKFAAENLKLAKEAKDDALRDMDDAAQGLVASLREGIEKQDEMREAKKAYNALSDEEMEQLDKANQYRTHGLSTITDFLGITSDTKEEASELRKESQKNAEELAKAKVELSNVISGYRQAGLSATEIARRTGLTVKEVQKYGGAQADAEKKALNTAAAAAAIADNTEDAVDQAKKLADAYKESSDALDTDFSNAKATLASLRLQLKTTKDREATMRAIVAQEAEVKRLQTELLERKNIEADIDEKFSIEVKRKKAKKDTEAKRTESSLTDQLVGIYKDRQKRLEAVETSAIEDSLARERKAAQDKADEAVTNARRTVEKLLAEVEKQAREKNAPVIMLDVTPDDGILNEVAVTAARVREVFSEQLQLQVDAIDKTLTADLAALTSKAYLASLEGLNKETIDLLQKQEAAITGVTEETARQRGAKRLELLRQQQETEIAALIAGMPAFQRYVDEQARLLEAGDIDDATFRSRVEAQRKVLEAESEAVKAIRTRQARDTVRAQEEIERTAVDARIALMEEGAEKAYEAARLEQERSHAAEMTALSAHVAEIQRLAAEGIINPDDATVRLGQLALKAQTAEAKHLAAMLALRRQYQQQQDQIVNAGVLAQTRFFEEFAINGGNTLKALNAGAAAAFEQVGAKFGASARLAADEYIRLSSLTDEELKKLGVTTEQVGSQMTTFLRDSALSFGGIVADAAVSGENILKASANAALDIALKFLEMKLPIWIAGIFGTTVAEMGPLGLLAVGGLTAALSALVAAAKGAVKKFAHGGRVTGGRNQLVMVNDGSGRDYEERIVDGRSTRENEPALSWLERHPGRNLREFYRRESSMFVDDRGRLRTERRIERVEASVGDLAKRLDRGITEVAKATKQVAARYQSHTAHQHRFGAVELHGSMLKASITASEADALSLM